MGLQLTASVMAMASAWRVGDKHVSGPLLGLASQVPWWALMIHDGLWGLLPINAAMVILHTRNTYKWMA